MRRPVGCMQTTTEEAIHDGGAAAARLGWTDGRTDSHTQTILGRRLGGGGGGGGGGGPEVTKGFVRGCGRRQGRGWLVY